MHSQGPLTVWSLVVVPIGSEGNLRGQVVLRDSAGDTVVTSDVDKFYNGDFYTLMLRQNDVTSSADFQIKRFDDDVFEFEFETSVISPFISSFRSGEITLGSSPLLPNIVCTSSNNIRID